MCRALPGAMVSDVVPFTVWLVLGAMVILAVEPMFLIKYVLIKFTPYVDSTGVVSVIPVVQVQPVSLLQLVLSSIPAQLGVPEQAPKLPEQEPVL